MEFREYWDNSHLKYSMGTISYDNWLDKYKSALDECRTEVLDLGCGAGNDTLYLISKGLKVVSCDFSQVALDKISRDIEGSQTLLMDISKPFPFEDNSFDLIVADLSLHYFDEETTFAIMQEIKRVLTANGKLIARVNSTDDINYGAQQGVMIEDNFYFVGGYNKRFFNFDDVNKFFSRIGSVEIKEADMLRYSKPKKVIEIMTRKS